MRRQQFGECNPNFKNAGWHTCEICKNKFHNYNKTRRFCSKKCTSSFQSARMRAIDRSSWKKTRRSVKTGRNCICRICNKEFKSIGKSTRCADHRLMRTPTAKSRVLRMTGVNIQCQKCRKEFYVPPSSKRKYCSYKCHLDSGGAKRAGMFSAMAMKIYGHKKDANHKTIVDALTKFGVAVIDLSMVGCGIPDLVVWCRGEWYLVDIKNPKTGYGRRGLNKVQRGWAEKWKGGPVYLISTVEEAADLVSGKLAELKCFPEIAP